MNSLRPAASRFLPGQPWDLLPPCRRIDSLAAQVAQRSLHSYSIPSLSCKWEGNPRTAPLRKRFWPSNRRPSGIGVRTYASRRIITKFEDIPKNYNDQDGLTFSVEPLRQEDVVAIFGKGIDVTSANRLLAVLHGRRVAGTLADPDALTSLNVYQERARQIGLAWLRKNIPVDEIRSAGLQAEEQLAAMQQDLIADGERIGIWKPNSTQKGKNEVYGGSVLDAVRKQKEREFEEREKAKQAQAEEIRQNTGTLEVAPQSKVELRRAGENPKLKYYMERQKVLPDTPPEMSMFQRLWPSGLLVLAVVLGCVVFSQVYTPPKRSGRLMPDMPPAAATVLGIVLINFVIFTLWHHPPAFRYLNMYFMTTPGYVRPLSLIGNIFSHQGFSHLAWNMTVLYFVGTRLHDEIGRGNFLALYVACGALGSFTSLTSWVIRGSFVSSSLGASGALAGVIASYLWLHSGEAVKLLGIFPPDGWPNLSSLVFLAILIAADVIGLTRLNRRQRNMDHWAHLGGYGAGIGAAEYLKRRVRRRRAAEEERKQNMGFVDKIRERRL